MGEPVKIFLSIFIVIHNTAVYIKIINGTQSHPNDIDVHVEA
jgi:hypothetical protein